MSPLVSIITLSYNNSQFYKSYLESVINQTYNNIELLICDDCSDYFVEDEIEVFINANKRENIKNVIIEKNNVNLGVVKNYKKAISRASGEIIFYVAIDDMLYDNQVVEDVVKYFETHDERIFTGYREEFDETGMKRIRPYPHEVDLLCSKNRAEIYKKLIRYNFIIGACTPFKKSLVEEYGFLNEKYKHLEDWPRYLNLLSQGENIGFYNRRLIKYRQGGITTNEHINSDVLRDFGMTRRCYWGKEYKNLLVNIALKKKIIGWGASGDFIASYDKWCHYTNTEVSYLVDKNKCLWNTEVNGVKVYPIDRLEDENKEEIFILVFSMAYYIQIANELEEMGFIEGVNFELVCKNMVMGIEYI